MFKQLLEVNIQSTIEVIQLLIFKIKLSYSSARLKNFRISTSQRVFSLSQAFSKLRIFGCFSLCGLVEVV